MSRKYKFKNPEGIYFVSFATVGWIDVFTRRIYKDILVESLIYCQKEKGLELYAWCIMSNHIHLICRSRSADMSGFLRDFKRHTSKELIRAIQNNIQESRKEWMLSIFEKAGKHNGNNTNYQFWRQDNKPIELYSNNVINQKLEYIHNNPVAEGYVDQPYEYLYSSARDYCEIKGLIDITLIS